MLIMFINLKIGSELRQIVNFDCTSNINASLKKFISTTSPEHVGPLELRKKLTYQYSIHSNWRRPDKQ